MSPFSLVTDQILMSIKKNSSQSRIYSNNVLLVTVYIHYIHCQVRCAWPNRLRAGPEKPEFNLSYFE